MCVAADNAQKGLTYKNTRTHTHTYTHTHTHTHTNTHPNVHSHTATLLGFFSVTLQNKSCTHHDFDKDIFWLDITV